MSKTDDQLRGEISINEARAEWGAWAIVVGLVFEVVIALTVSFDIDKKWIDNWGAVIADCLIALGVYAEIHFGRKASGAARELQQRSDVKIAEADARAAEAQLETARLRAREPFVNDAILATADATRANALAAQ